GWRQHQAGAVHGSLYRHRGRGGRAHHRDAAGRGRCGGLAGQSSRVRRRALVDGARMMDFFEVIRTPRCLISQLKEKDVEALRAITDSSVTSLIHFLPEPFTLTDAEALITGSSSEEGFFGVWDTGGTDLKGVIGVHPKENREIEIGYWFSSSERGK